MEAPKQSFYDEELFPDSGDEPASDEDPDWISKWGHVDENAIESWQFPSMREAKDAASNALFRNEQRFFGRKVKGSNGHFVCKTCANQNGNQKGRGFKVKQKGKKVDPNAYYIIQLFGEHTTDCEVIQENDKKKNNGAVTIDKQSGAMNILNAMMKSPRLIKVYNTYIEQRKRGVNKEAKDKIWKIVRETFKEVHNVHLNFVERTFFNYMKKINAEEGVEMKEDKAGEGGRKRNRDEFDAAADLQNTEINLEPPPTTTFTSSPTGTSRSPSPFFEDGCNDTKQVYHGWLNAVRCGCLDEMKSAHSKMYSLIWWTHDDDYDSSILGIGDEDDSMHFANSKNARDWYGYKIAAKAVEFGQTDALQNLRKYGCPMDRTAPIMAVTKNNLEMLELLYIFNNENFDKIAEEEGFMDVQNIACWGDRVPGLLKNQFKWVEIIDGWLCETAAKQLDEKSTEKFSKWFETNRINTKKDGGHHGVGRRKKRNDLPVKDVQLIDPPCVVEGLRINYSTAENFFEKGLMHNDEEQIFYGWINAARCGCSDVMEWAYQQGYSTIWGATWGHGHNYEYNSECELICAKAAEYGRLENLKKLRSLRCPWSAHTTTMASKHGHFATLQWAVENGCKVNWADSIHGAEEKGFQDIADWLKTKSKI